MKKTLVVIYVATLIGVLEFFAIQCGIDGVALYTAIGGLCVLVGLLFDVNVAEKIYHKIFPAKRKVNYAEKKDVSQEENCQESST